MRDFLDRLAGLTPAEFARFMEYKNTLQGILNEQLEGFIESAMRQRRR
jgi:hypothetical protein